MKFHTYEKPAAIEDLTFQIKPERVDAFIRCDQEIWTTLLAQYDSDMTKEVWVDATQKGKVVTVIYWSDYEKWKSIPQKILDETQKRFDDAFGAQDYQMTHAGHTQTQLYRKYAFK